MILFGSKDVVYTQCTMRVLHACADCFCSSIYPQLNVGWWAFSQTMVRLFLLSAMVCPIFCLLNGILYPLPSSHVAQILPYMATNIIPLMIWSLKEFLSFVNPLSNNKVSHFSFFLQIFHPKSPFHFKFPFSYSKIHVVMDSPLFSRSPIFLKLSNSISSLPKQILRISNFPKTSSESHFLQKPLNYHI